VNRTYLPYELAQRAGVTIRALHHYDRLGLLKPSGRTRAGYRVHSDRDFARLEQIVALKFIRFPLFQIRELPRRKDTDLLAALRQQRQILTEKRNHLDRAVRAIERAEEVVCLRAGSPIGSHSARSSR
jgi:DNA-binding transcriptional MerR regulator